MAGLSGGGARRGRVGTIADINRVLNALYDDLKPLFDAYKTTATVTVDFSSSTTQRVAHKMNAAPVWCYPLVQNGSAGFYVSASDKQFITIVSSSAAVVATFQLVLP